jgi:hypothetical protein
MTRQTYVNVNGKTPLECVAREVFYAYCTVMTALLILTAVAG